MNILLTGASGFIGRQFVERLKKEGFPYLAIGRVTDWQHAKQQIETFGPEVFVNLANCYCFDPSVQMALDMLNANVVFPSLVLHSCPRVTLRHVVSVGTNWQAGANGVFHAPNFYAATKNAFDDIVLSAMQRERFSGISLRLCDTLGPGDNRPKIIPELLKAAREGKKFPTTAGEQRLFIAHVDDVVEGIFHATAGYSGDTPGKLAAYYLRPAQMVTLRELITLTVAIAAQSHGLQVVVDWGARPYRQNEVMEPFTQGTVLPGWSPRHSLTETLQQTIDHWLTRGLEE